MSKIANTEVVMARWAQLERDNRILKRWLALLVIVFGALFIMRQAPSRPHTLEAEKLIIRDPNGKEAIVLGADALGATVTVRFPNGKDGIVLEAAGGAFQSAGAYFAPPDGGEARVWIKASVDTLPAVSSMPAVYTSESGVYVMSPTGKLRVEMSATAHESVDHGDLSIVSSVLGSPSFPGEPAPKLFVVPVYALEANASGNAVSETLYKEGKVLWRAP